MTNKQKRKLLRRAHIASAIMVQNQYIANAGLPVPADRRTKDRLFAKAREAVNGVA